MLDFECKLITQQVKDGDQKYSNHQITIYKCISTHGKRILMVRVQNLRDTSVVELIFKSFFGDTYSHSELSNTPNMEKFCTKTYWGTNLDMRKDNVNE